MAGDADQKASPNDEIVQASPVLSAIAYPPHMAYVPPVLVGYNVAFWFLAWAPLWLVFGGIANLLIMAGIAVTHIFLAIKYTRNPYFYAEWRAWWAARRWPVSRQAKTMRPLVSGNWYIP